MRVGLLVRVGCDTRYHIGGQILGNLAMMTISTRLIAMMIPVYLIIFCLLLLVCYAIFPTWVLIGVPVLVVLSALADRANRNKRP